jgi:hypothetical protein
MIEQSTLTEPSVIGTVKGIVEAAGLEYWLALPLLYFIAGLRRILDAVSLNVQSVGRFVTFGEDFSAAVEDWAWRILSVGFACFLSGVGVWLGVLDGQWLVVGCTNGVGAVAAFHVLKAAGLLKKLGLEKNGTTPSAP